MKHDDVIGKDSLPPSRPMAEYLAAGNKVFDMVDAAALLGRMARALEWAVEAHGCGPGCGKCDAPWCVEARAVLKAAGRPW